MLAKKSGYTFKQKSGLVRSSHHAACLLLWSPPPNTLCHAVAKLLAGGVPGLIYPLRSILDRISLEELFRARHPLEVELGSGDGSFLVEYAVATRSAISLVWSELLGRIRKMDRKGQRAGLSNLRGVRIESSLFPRVSVADHSAEALHVYFSRFPGRSESTGGIGPLLSFSGACQRALAPADGCT